MARLPDLECFLVRQEPGVGRWATVVPDTLPSELPAAARGERLRNDRPGGTGTEDVYRFWRMEPPFAIIGLGAVFGFAFRTDELFLDGAPAPPTLLPAARGTPPGWTGLYLPGLRIFVNRGSDPVISMKYLDEQGVSHTITQGGANNVPPRGQLVVTVGGSIAPCTTTVTVDGTLHTGAAVTSVAVDVADARTTVVVAATAGGGHHNDSNVTFTGQPRPPVGRCLPGRLSAPRRPTARGSGLSEVTPRT